MALPTNTRFGRYEIRDLLGAGGMGEVYLAQDTTLRRSVAIKLLPADITLNKDRLNRFEREALAASRLNHPHILTIHEIGAVNGRQFIATEFIEGETPSDRISAILTTEPPILTRYVPEVPAELERIVTKALRKDKEERYQSVKDFGLDLKSLKHRLEFQAELDRTQTPQKTADTK